ncbi:MAG: hypothetical protein F6K31_04355 [Symploca sp. SIO2G7]|nr:hypothetical protein [Symploca sp. SIO2G7]
MDATDFPLTSGVSWDGESQHVDFGPPQLLTQWLYRPSTFLVLSNTSHGI